MNKLKHLKRFNESDENLNTGSSTISDVSRSTYPSLHRLFDILPKIGYGDKKQFKGTENDLNFAYSIIESLASTSLVFKRTEYLMDGGEMNIDDWYDNIKNENTFQSYMLQNYPLENGVFIFDKNIDELEKIASKYFEYYD